MIKKENMVYFHKNETSEHIKSYANKLWSYKHNDSIFQSDDECLLEKIKSHTFVILNPREKGNLIDLLKKEKDGFLKLEQEIFDQKFFFFFALLDFIIRNKISHVFKYEGDAGYFEGEFKDEFSKIQQINDTNPLSFYSYGEKKKLLNLSTSFESVAKKIGMYFISDMLEDEYTTLLKRYISFKKSVEQNI